MKRCSVGLIIILAVVLGAVVVVESAHHGAHVVVPPGQPGPRTGPSYLYPDPITTPGKSYEQITQATIGQTICNPNWSTRSIRPDSSYTDGLKRRQLQSVRYQRDRNPAHFEEDHFIPLELGGHPSDEKNLWPEMWGTPDHPQGAHDRFDPTVIGAHAKDKVEDALKLRVCPPSPHCAKSTDDLTLKEAQDIITKDWYRYFRENILK